MRNKWDFREILQKNAVTVMFVVLCLIGLVCSGQTVSYVMYELFGRLSRNSFIGPGPDHSDHCRNGNQLCHHHWCYGSPDCGTVGH